MEERQELKFMCQLLVGCYSLRIWILDEQMQIVDSTCTHELEKEQAHMLLQWSDALRAHFSQSDRPLILTNKAGMMWGAVIVADVRHICIMGPVFTQDMPAHTLDRLVDELDVSEDIKRGARKYLHQVNAIPSPAFMQLLSMLNYSANGSVIQFSDFVFHSEEVQIEQRKPAETLDEKPAMHAPLMTDKMLMDMVRTGNLDYNDVLSAARMASPGIRTTSSDPIRQAQYSSVAFITLCSRAAIEGGLSSDVAFTLSDVYVQRIDHCRTVGEIASVNHIMYEDYIRRVNQCRMSAGRSRPVQACCDYIETHLTSDLTVELLAKRAGYADYYFSRLFKKETGISIKEYIRRARIADAKILLRTSQLSIQEISERLRFCSRSYFADQFQKTVGVTPVEYRASHIK